MNTTCPRCGAAFECGAENVASEPCWCMRLPPLPIPADQQTTCLCPHCLRAALDELGVSRKRNP